MSLPPRSLVEIDDLAGGRRLAMVRLDSATYSEQGMNAESTPGMLHPILNPQQLGTFWEYISKNNLQEVLHAAMNYLRRARQHDVIEDPVMLPKMVHALMQSGKLNNISDIHLSNALGKIRRDEQSIKTKTEMTKRYLKDIQNDLHYKPTI